MAWLATATATAAADPPAGAISATSASIAADAAHTTFELALSKGVTAEVFTLANPYRVIVDLPDVAFTLSPNAGKTGRGLVSAYRYGLFAERKARIVIDVTGPVAIAKADMRRAPGGSGVVLAISLSPVDAATFGEGTGATRAPAAAKASPEKAARPAQAKTGARPVVMIDPGHGGIDPGAVGASNIAEKTVVLSVAQHLQAKLNKTGLYDVRMTREKDVFVSLDRRLEMSHEAEADLFLSLHADAIEETNFAESVSGATIYTLSDRASDEKSRRIAEKENASDLLAGLETTAADGQDQVKDILIDLLRRETKNFSADFSNVLARRLAKSIAMSRDPQRSAAFKVLKQTHAPSVLIELGYMSNSKDQKEMATDEWQTKVASAISAAITAYFAKRTTKDR